MTRIALVAGATGLIGSRLLPQLLADKRYAQVKVLSRRALSLHHERLQVLITDYRDLGALGPALAADDVYCCLGTTMRAAGSKQAFERVDYHMVVDLAQAARAAGAQRLLVISSVGTSSKALAYYSRVKARMEQAVSQISFAATHILRPSLLLGTRQEHRPGEAFAQKAAPLLRVLLHGPLARYRPVEATAVARTMIELAFSDRVNVHIHHLPLART